MKHLMRPTLNQAKSLQLAHGRKLLLRMWKRMFGRRRFIMPDWWRVKLWRQ